MKIALSDMDGIGAENPYAAPLSGPTDTITEEQYANRIALRGCLSTLVLVGGSVGAIATFAYETITTKKGKEIIYMDPDKLIQVVVAIVCASIGSLIWQSIAKKKDFRRIEREKVHPETAKETLKDVF